MNSGSRGDFGRQFSSDSLEERVVFYMNEMSSERCPESAPELKHHPNCYSLYPISPDDEHRRSISACSQTDRPRRSRQGSDVLINNRRSSVHSGQSRTRANSRVTPLGDGRRASICKRGGKVRRPSTAQSHRRDSVRPSRAEIKVLPIELKTPEQIQRARRHRRIAMIVVGTFVFLLAASVLAVVVTLTHSSFYIPHTHTTHHKMKKENEALLNSLKRDSSIFENSTASSFE